MYIYIFHGVWHFNLCTDPGQHSYRECMVRRSFFYYQHADIGQPPFPPLPSPPRLTVTRLTTLTEPESWRKKVLLGCGVVLRSLWVVVKMRTNVTVARLVYTKWYQISCMSVFALVLKLFCLASCPAGSTRGSWTEKAPVRQVRSATPNPAPPSPGWPMSAQRIKKGSPVCCGVGSLTKQCIVLGKNWYQVKPWRQLICRTWMKST